MATLSAVVVAHNEAARLGGCLAALRFADEVLVVLDRCTDNSRAVAEAAGARILEGAFPREAARRHAGLDAATGDWVLEIDADETVSPALADEIREVIRTSAAGRHAIPVDNYVGGRLIRHGWGATIGVQSKQILFRRGSKRWGPERVHPKVTFSAPLGAPLRNALSHDIAKDSAALWHRLDRYAALRAQDLREVGVPETLSQNFWRIFGRFYKCYVRRRGYQEGAFGVYLALLAALYPLLSYLKARMEPADPSVP